MSIFMIRSESPCVSFTFFKIPAIILQGAHHSAKTSTRTGVGDDIKSANVSIKTPF
jgi:hypothetical protein